MPTQYIHEPWTAPGSVQQAAKCVIGKDYPLPMVNHSVASRTNIQRMKQVYQQLIKYRNVEQDRGKCGPPPSRYREVCYRPTMVTVGNSNFGNQ